MPSVGSRECGSFLIGLFGYHSEKLGEAHLDEKFYHVADFVGFVVTGMGLGYG